MLVVCPNCGEYTPEKLVFPGESDSSGRTAFAECPGCGYTARFLRLPLFLVTGPSGVGKTTVSEILPLKLPQCVVLESDVLWRKEFDTPTDDYQDFHNMWLGLARDIQQCGKPVVLCGTVVPDQLEGLVQRRFFARLYYLALVCRRVDVLKKRLEERPAWRYHHTDRKATIERTVRFNSWFLKNARKTKPAMSLLDTSESTREDVVSGVAEWVLGELRGAPGPG